MPGSLLRYSVRYGTHRRLPNTYGLKVIYDAYCFGVKQDNASILNYGDLSVLSFHATKVFNTFEGYHYLPRRQNQTAHRLS